MTIRYLNKWWRWWYEDNYDLYIRSWRWKLRKQKIRRRDKTCVSCGSYHNLEVHHRRYSNIFNEPLHDLALFCPNCHAWADQARTERNSKRPLISVPLHKLRRKG